MNTGPRRIYRICKRVLYFEEGKAGKYGRGDEEDFFPWRKVGGFRMAIVGVVCLHVCSTVVCVCLCGGMERVYLN